MQCAAGSPLWTKFAGPSPGVWLAGSIRCATRPTTRRIIATRRARVSLADTDDVVIVVASAAATPYESTLREVADLFAARAGWDPRQEAGRWSLLTLTPETIHASKGEPELVGRTIMRHGEWVGK